MANLSQDKTVRCINSKTKRVKWFSPAYLAKPNNAKYLKYLGYIVDDPVQDLETKQAKLPKPKKVVETVKEEIPVDKTVKEDIPIDETSEPTFDYPEYDDITANEIKAILEDKKIDIPKRANKTDLYNLLTGQNEG